MIYLSHLLVENPRVFRHLHLGQSYLSIHSSRCTHLMKHTNYHLSQEQYIFFDKIYGQNFVNSSIIFPFFHIIRNFLETDFFKTLYSIKSMPIISARIINELLIIQIVIF